MPSTQRTQFVLPGIHEMFPDFSFPDPPSHPPYSPISTRPPPGSEQSSSGSSNGDGENMDVEEGPSSKEEKKHACDICGSRFDRPSSLKIHRNTHTGATPFRCPHPGCGREFNVNSNMRRHLRRHKSAPPSRLSRLVPRPTPFSCIPPPSSTGYKLPGSQEHPSPSDVSRPRAPYPRSEYSYEPPPTYQKSTETPWLPPVLPPVSTWNGVARSGYYASDLRTPMSRGRLLRCGI